MPACVINTRYVEVVEIALVCLNYERMTFRAVALESIAFEVDCSLKVFLPQGGTGPSTKCPSVPKWKWDICLSDWPQSLSAKRHFFTLRLYVCDPWRTLLLIWVLLVFLASAKNEWPCREYPTLWRVQGSWNDSVSWFASLENSGVLIFWNLAVHFEGSLAFMGDILCMTYLSSVPVLIVLRNLLRGPLFYRLWLTGNTKKHCDKPPKSKAKYAASRVWGTASIWERISASVDSRESRSFGTETPTGSKGGHWALPHASPAPEMLFLLMSCNWVYIHMFPWLQRCPKNAFRAHELPLSISTSFPCSLEFTNR